MGGLVILEFIHQLPLWFRRVFSVQNLILGMRFRVGISRGFVTKSHTWWLLKTVLEIMNFPFLLRASNMLQSLSSSAWQSCSRLCLGWWCMWGPYSGDASGKGVEPERGTHSVQCTHLPATQLESWGCLPNILQPAALDLSLPWMQWKLIFYNKLLGYKSSGRHLINSYSC